MSSSSFGRVNPSKRQREEIEQTEEGTNNDSSNQLPLKNLRLNKRGRLCGNLREDIPFGVLGIDVNKLKQNIISIVRRSTNKKIDKLPNMKINQAFHDIMLQVLQGLYPEEQIQSLSKEEQKYLQLLLKTSMIDVHKLINPATYELKNLSDKELQKRLIVNIGQLESGNNSKALKEESKEMVEKLINDKKKVTKDIKYILEELTQRKVLSLSQFKHYSNQLNL